MLTLIMKAYLYVQYAGDDPDEDLVAFFVSYNGLAQDFYTSMVELDLPDYTVQAGALLDWVALGLYGIARPLIPSGELLDIGPLNTWELNTLELNAFGRVFGPDFALASDDIFKRVITWRFYKGDGYQFTTAWLKRRVARFIYGDDGTDPLLQDTYTVSVEHVGANVYSIRIDDSVDPLLLAALIYLVRNGTLSLPFQYIFDVAA